ARELLGDVGTHPALEVRISDVEVTRERRGEPVLAAERARQPVEIDAAELDQVRADPAAPHHLRAERGIDLVGTEDARCDQELAEPRPAAIRIAHRAYDNRGEPKFASAQATVTSLDR